MAYFYTNHFNTVRPYMHGSRQLSWYSDLLRYGRFWDWIPVEARFSAPVQTSSGAHPASYAMGTVSFPEVKRPGRGVGHQPPSKAEVKERVELNIYFPSGPSWPVLGQTYHYLGLFLQPTLMHNSITTCMSHYYPRHVSGVDMPILRRNNCTNTASDILALIGCCTVHRLRAVCSQPV